jgi:acetolactate synthase-1/2/3 large subunit
VDVNQSVVKILESVGVDHVFGGSGQVNATMLLALRDSKLIKTVIVRNEQAASFMACGYAMFSRKLGVCFATGGPGAFNLFSGMAVAYSDSLPIIGITGYVSAGMRGKGALNEASGLNRTPDSHKMFSLTTKKSFLLEDPEQTCNVFEEAINIAFEGRPGPVHVHIPKDVTGAPVSSFRPIRLDVKPVLPDACRVKELAGRIADGIAANETMALLIGYGCYRSGAQTELLQLVDAYQIPFMTTMDAKGILSEDHPLCQGVFGSSGDPGANAYFDRCSMILSLGNSFAQNATFAYRANLFQKKTLLHVNIDPAEIDKVYRADVGLVSDIKPALQGILAELAARKPPVTKKAVGKDTWYDTPISYNGKKIHPAALVKVISENLPAESIVLGDAGSDMLWLSCYLKLTKNQIYQNPGSFGPMASHCNASMGMKCAFPDKTIVCGVGDGAYLMAGFELLTAVQYDIPVIWVIFNNGEFNIIKKFLIDMYGDHAFMQFQNPDFVAYAKACGAQGYRVERIEDFAPIFIKALWSKKPTLIDAVVESEVYPPFAMGRV